MSRLEAIDGENWADLLGAEASVLVLGRSDCAACAAWGEELQAYLAKDERWNGVRFGTMTLDDGGLATFKKANPWVTEICELPTNLIYVRGEQVKRYVGGGAHRLEERLEKVLGGV